MSCRVKKIFDVEIFFAATRCFLFLPQPSAGASAYFVTVEFIKIRGEEIRMLNLNVEGAKAP